MAAPAKGGVTVFDPATGKLASVAPEVASTQLKRGAVQAQESTIRVVRGNEVIETTPDKLAEAESYGWALADDEGVRTARVRDEESTFLSQVQGTAEAGASGLTFGLSDLALAKAGMDPERMRARSEAAGDAAAAARLAGEVLPIALSGGAAGAARGGAMGLGKAAIRRAGALPRLVEGAGVLAEKGVAKAFGTGLGARTAGAAVRGGVEGFASGVGQEIHEAVLGNRELAAEKVLMSGGMAGLFGGAAGAAFPLTGHVFKKAGGAMTDATRAVIGKAQGMDPKGSIVGDMAQTIASGKRAGPAKAQLELLRKDNPKLYRALHEQDAVVEEIGTGLRDAADAYGDAQRRGVQAFEADRAGNFGNLLADTGDGQVARYVVDDIDGALVNLDGSIAYADTPQFRKNYDMQALQKSRAALEVARDAADATGAKAGKAYQEQVVALRKVQDELTRLKKLDKSPDTVDMVAEVEQMLKDNLGNAKYGRAAQGFREVTAADAAYFIEAEKMGPTSVGRLLDRNKLSTNADAVDVAKQYGKFKSADRISAAELSMAKDAAAMRKRAEYSDSPAMLKAANDMDAAIVKMQGAMGKAGDNATILARQTEMGRSPLSGVLSAMGPSGAAVVGSLLGGPVGAAIGGGLAMMARPGSAIRTMSAIKHAADGSGLKLDGIVKAITATTGKAGAKAAKAAKKARPRRRAAAARPLATRAAARAAPKRDESQRKRQKRAYDLSDPNTLEAELATEMFALNKAAPGVAGVMAERVAIGAKFLASKLPYDTVDPITGERPRVDEATLAKFDRYHEAVTDPIASLERLTNGTFTTEHAEALREVWPALFADIQERTLLGMQEAADAGERLPYARRMSLGVLLSIPTDATLTPSFMATMAEIHGAERAKEGAEAGQGPAPKTQDRTRKTTMKTPKNYATTLGRLETSDI